jgi:hypothetical protein
MVAGLAGALLLGPLAPSLLGRPSVGFTWNVAIGAVITAAVGLAASRSARPARQS